MVVIREKGFFPAIIKIPSTATSTYIVGSTTGSSLATGLRSRCRTGSARSPVAQSWDSRESAKQQFGDEMEVIQLRLAALGMARITLTDLSA